MSTIPFLTAGRIIISLAAISNSISPYIADFNKTHVYNPNWPPHARFHNGQTMSLGLVLGFTTLYFAWRPAFSSISFTKTMIKDSMFSAALVGSLYWITGVTAGLYPGAKFLDPEFIGSKYDAKVLGLPGQAPVFVAHMVFCWIGYALEARRLGGMKVE